MNEKAEEIWKRLSAIDCSEHIEKKGKFNYLSWAWAWGELKKVYPTAKYLIKKDDNGLPYFKDDGGVICFVEVTVMDLTHEMWLPVMDYNNRALVNPSMTEVNKTIMRCLVKCLAMFGLGHYIYAGEDLPEQPIISKEDAKTFLAFINGDITSDTAIDFYRFISSMTEEQLNEFNKLYPSGQIAKGKEQWRRLNAEAFKIMDAYVSDINNCCANEDLVVLKQLLSELTGIEKNYVWNNLEEQHKNYIKGLEL